MKRLIVASVALAAMTVSSLAADIRPSSRMEMAPVRAPALLPFHWGGWHAGLNLGGGFSDVSGVVFGGQIGYSIQMDRWVFGLETDLQVSGQDGSRTVTDSTGAAVAITHDLDWFGTFRGRVGYAIVDRWLPYFTVGLAYGGRTARVPGTGISADDTNVGWAIGVGVDYAINQWWTARLEYLHVSLDGFSLANAGVTAPVGDLENDIVRGAINYRFMP